MKLPSYVDVGPYRYTIERDLDAINAARVEARSADLTGWSDHRTQRIILDPDLGRDALAETLAHEVGHAILEQHPTGLDDERTEAVALALGFGLLDVVRQNPKLVAYLADLSHRKDTTE